MYIGPPPIKLVHARTYVHKLYIRTHVHVWDLVTSHVFNVASLYSAKKLFVEAAEACDVSAGRIQVDHYEI